ncbi:MAG: hypothetical protein V3G42_05470 [Oscillospiraceae bacterium]
MQAILFCNRFTECIPMQNYPETLLPFCNVPFLAHMLKYLEKSGFQSVTLLSADEQTKRMLDGLRLEIPIYHAVSLASLKAETPTLLLRRLCIPEWDMGELYSICGKGTAKLYHSDSTPTYAEVHPTGSALLEPRETAILQNSFFHHAETPIQYRQIQQRMLKGKIGIGENVHLGTDSNVDNASVIGNDCIIAEGAKIQGCILGDGVQVGKNAVLEECVICRNAFIGENSHLKGAVIPENAVFEHGAKMTKSRQILVLPEDGICCHMPEWNTTETALQAGAGMAVLGKNIVMGYSNPNGEYLTMSVISGAVSQGCHVWNCGSCTLSQLIDTASRTKSDSILWVEGDSTFKLLPFRADGSPLTNAQTIRLWRALESQPAEKIRQCGKVSNGTMFADLWEAELSRIVPEHLPEISVSCANSILRERASRIFGNGDGEAMTLTISEDGTSATVFSMSAGMIRKEQLILLAMLSICQKGEPIVLPEDFHPIAEQFASSHHCRVIRFHEKSPTAMELYQNQKICMDGAFLFAHVLRTLVERNLTLKQAVSMLPKICTIQKEVQTSLTRQAVERLHHATPEPAVKMTLPPQGKLLKLRIHADSMEMASEICGIWEKKVRQAEQTNF